jgi:putative CocE/NonD family hydrolase
MAFGCTDYLAISFTPGAGPVSRSSFLLFVTLTSLIRPGHALQQSSGDMVRDTNVVIPMRDSVLLTADILRPPGEGPFPVLVYRTPYDKVNAVAEHSIFRKAVDRGYAVVVQDVRGRYASSGEFTAYRQEGADGYDTIEWAAAQPWSTGEVGTFGLSYPGAVQWLAAVESPPHLKAMVPAMTFATPRTFFYSGGVWDLSWISWIWYYIAPDVRVRRGLSGPRSYEEAAEQWPRVRDQMLGYLPLRGLPNFKQIAPWYYEWLNHPPHDPWWNWAELTGKYRRTRAAILNISGWHDEAYGPSGAIRNFRGILASRQGRALNARLVIGPWAHGVGGMARTTVGDREMGSQAAIDYDEIVLRWMDRHVRGIDNGVDQEPRVQIFVMGENRWIESTRWPLAGTRQQVLYLAGPDSTSTLGRLITAPNRDPEEFSIFESDPATPVIDPYAESPGPHDYRSLVSRQDVLTFETAPLEEELRVVGAIAADIHLAVEGQDTDLWVRIQDVAPDGTAYNLMHPGLDVLRASFRNPGQAPSHLVPNRIYRLRLDNLLTGNLFRQGHRLRIQISTTFYPWFSRNLHTGDSEVFSDNMQPARITIFHDRRRPSRITLPVVGSQP